MDIQDHLKNGKIEIINVSLALSAVTPLRFKIRSISGGRNALNISENSLNSDFRKVNAPTCLAPVPEGEASGPRVFKDLL
jgi:hypothetical protein